MLQVWLDPGAQLPGSRLSPQLHPGLLAARLFSHAGLVLSSTWWQRWLLAAPSHNHRAYSLQGRERHPSPQIPWRALIGPVCGLLARVLGSLFPAFPPDAPQSVAMAVSAAGLLPCWRSLGPQWGIIKHAIPAFGRLRIKNPRTGS